MLDWRDNVWRWTQQGNTERAMFGSAGGGLVESELVSTPYDPLT